MLTEITPAVDWRRITQELAAPFPPDVVEWMPQASKRNSAKGQAIAYLSSAAVQDRLDAVVGAGGWSFTWEPIVVEGGEVRVAHGRLTIYGVTKEDIGTASNWEPSKGTITDALKRCASLWGIGRYLRGLPTVWVDLDDKGQIPAATLARLGESLARFSTRVQPSAAAAAASAGDTAAQTTQTTAASGATSSPRHAASTPQQPQQTTQATTQAAAAANTQQTEWEPSADAEFCRRLRAVGITTQGQFKAFLDESAEIHGKSAQSRAYALLAQKERLAAQPVAHDLRTHGPAVGREGVRS